MKKLLILFFTVSIIPSVVFSQGEYLEKGQNGFGISGAFLTNQDENAFGASVGYSFKGIFDIGFGYTREISDDEPKIYANNISPSISIHLLKQNETFPIALSIGASYVKGYYSSDFFDYYGFKLSSSGYILAGKIFRKIQLGSSFSIMPLVGISYYSLTLKAEIPSQPDRTEDDSATIFNLGLPLIFDLNKKTMFVISPGLSINNDKDYNTFVISLSFIFSTS